MLLDSEACFRAVRTRDRRFDGRFFVAVSSTGIYCRPICPVRPPKRENMRFFSSAAAAEGQGFRPCMRCRPERAPGLATVDAVSRLVRAAIAGIEEHALSSASVLQLAQSLGVSDRHLRRVTESELGVSPIELAQTQRLLLAKRLLGETGLSITDIAMASGFGSVRRFNALFKQRYRMSPRALRSSGASGRGLICQLDFRPPFAWDSLLAYLRTRAIPGVEMVDAGSYRRTVSLDGHLGWFTVSPAKSAAALDVEISASLAQVVGAVLSRVKYQFDLGADPHAVSALLARDDILRPTVERLPGLRVAGAFDGFELAVRAVLGQQISVKAATTMAGRWANAFGDPIETPYPELNRLTPRAEVMAQATPDGVCPHGIIGTRARCIIALAKAVCERRMTLSYSADVESQVEKLQSLPGIGPWTAQYIAMRALHWPDAFPSGDLMLLRAANLSKNLLESARKSGARGARMRRIICGNRWEPTHEFFTFVDSPIGRIMLTTDGAALTGLYMDIPRGWPSRTRDHTENPQAGVLPLATRQLEEYFAGRPARIRPAPASAGHGVSAPRLAGAAPDRLRGNLELWSDGEAHRQSDGVAGRRARHRQQSHFDHPTVSPRHRCERLADRLRRRNRAQTVAVGARGLAVWHG